MVPQIYKLVLKENQVFRYTKPGDENRLIRIDMGNGKAPMLTFDEYLQVLADRDV